MRHHRSAERAGGFSLLEFIVILLIMAIIAVFVTAKSPKLDNINLAGLSEQIITDLRYTQQLAIALDETHQMVFTSNSYQIQDSLGTPLLNPGIGSTTVNFPTGVTTTGQTISFDTLGAPNTGTTITLNSGSANKIITVTQETGFAEA